MFEFVDVYVFSNFNNADFKVELANTNWKDIKYSETTGNAEDGIVNFKVRAYDNFGIHVYPTNEKANITVAVSATEPSKTYLASPFRKATAAELNIAGENNSTTNPTPQESSSNTWLYVAFGVAVLVIVLLIGMMLGRKKAAGIIVIFLLSSPTIFAQQHNGNTWHDTQQYRNWLNSNRPSNTNNPSIGGAFRNLDKFEKALNKNVNQAVDIYTKAKDLYKIGTLATIIQTLKLPDGTVKVLVEGLQRVTIKKLIEILIQSHIIPVKMTSITTSLKNRVLAINRCKRINQGFLINHNKNTSYINRSTKSS